MGNKLPRKKIGTQNPTGQISWRIRWHFRHCQCHQCVKTGDTTSAGAAGGDPIYFRDAAI